MYRKSSVGKVESSFEHNRWTIEVAISRRYEL